MKWHRGDRVVHIESNQTAVVEGWKDGRLLVLFGTANGRDYREWVDQSAVLPAEAVSR